MAAATVGIRNFTEFLEQNLKKKVLEYTLKPLTKPGDNFGAVVQAVDVKVVKNNENNDSEIIQLVVKTPVTCSFLAEYFQPAISFVKEVRFYSDIIPAVEQFEQAANVPENERVDAFIPCLGSRFSLDPNAQKADSDAVLLLENVKLQNFTNGNKTIGFDIEETRAVLKALAKFHALCVAIRRLQPEQFNTKIYPYLLPLESGTKDESLIESIQNDMRRLDGYSPEMHNKLQSVTRNGKEFNEITTRPTDTPYTTAVHKDLWISNIMIKKDAGPIKVKIYDFQLCYYQSFIHDLIYFLFTSVRNNDLKLHFKSLVDHYIAEFIKTLNFVKCPVEDYSIEKMWNEIRDKANIQLFRLLLSAKINMTNTNVTPMSCSFDENSFPLARPASKTVLDQWKFIIDTFIENSLI